MTQIELLLQYQQADMAADAFEAKIKRNPTRVAMKKNRDFLVEQQNAAKKLEAEVAQMTDRVETIKLAIVRLEEQLNQMAKRMQDTPPADLSKAQEAARDAQKLLSDLEDYPFWLALYQDRMTYPYRIEMWQYTDSGRVPGIESPVDINLYFVDEYF